MTALTVFPTFAQEKTPTGILTGFIYKKDGITPLKDALVELRKVFRSENKIKYGKTIYQSNQTDGSGEYSIKNLPIGDYLVNIKVNKKIYNVGKIDFYVNIIEGESNKISFSLLKRR